MRQEEIKKVVREGYAQIAQQDSARYASAKSCCGGTDLAQKSKLMIC